MHSRSYKRHQRCPIPPATPQDPLYPVLESLAVYLAGERLRRIDLDPTQGFMSWLIAIKCNTLRFLLRYVPVNLVKYYVEAHPDGL